MKKTIICILSFITLFGLVSCKNNEETKVIEENKYEHIYRGTSTEKKEKLSNQDVLNRASYGYRFNDVQGYNSWYFSYFNNVEIALTKINDKWQYDDANYLTDDGIIKTSNGAICYSYKASKVAKYNYGGTLLSNNQEGISGLVEVYSNNTLIDSFSCSFNDNVGIYHEGNIDLNVNDLLVFRISGSNVYFNPVVSTTSLDQSLYDTGNSWGYYGDIHCYYYNDILYLYHLWNESGTWFWNMKTTKDMFRYEDAGYDDSFVENHYMKQGSYPDVFLEEYTSSRDRTVFYDSQVNKYRSIGLCYLSTGGCDLALRTSDDEMGFMWSKKCVPLRTFHETTDGEPECSQLLLIEDRWYLITSVSMQSVHGVGGLSYWYGEKGQTIDEIDWQNLEENHLDGEDLCAAQIEKVGDLYYLFGWMPQSYNASNWGGYKNLAREVYVLPSGKLATRIDSYATKLLNKGKLFELESVNLELNDSSYAYNQKISSSFNLFDIELNNSNKVSFSLNNGLKTYYLNITKESDGIYLSVTDNLGFVSSKVYLTDTSCNKFSCKAVVDGSKIEFAVNDLKVLSARTSSVSNEFYPGFSSDGNAIITNISFNRLAQLYDIYD